MNSWGHSCRHVYVPVYLHEIGKRLRAVAIYMYM